MSFLHRFSPGFRTLLLLAAAVLLFVPLASAQGRPGGGPPPSGGRGGMPPGGRPNGQPGPGNPDAAPPANGAGAGAAGVRTRIGPLGDPPGRWWDDPAYVKSVGLDRNQQKRMDDVFGSNKGQLLRLYADLKRQEAELSKVSKAGVSEALLDSQIDRVAQARSELQKATTHLLLELHKELTPEQAARLEAAR